MNSVRSRRLAKGQMDECSRCFYCGSLLAPSHEHDHFPVPKSRGGREVVSACANCHDLKDRTQLGDYPISDLWTALWELIPFLRADLAEVSDSPTALVQKLDETVVLRAWPRLTHEARIVYGKLRSIEALAKKS